MKSIVYAFLTIFLWGLVPFMEKIGLSKLPVWTALFFRCLGVTVGIAILFLFKFPEFKQAITHPPAGWYYLAAGGLLASVVGQIFFYNALKDGNVSRIMPLVGTFPLVSFVLGVVFLKEAMTFSSGLGVLFVIAGVMLLK